MFDDYIDSKCKELQSNIITNDIEHMFNGRKQK